MLKNVALGIAAALLLVAAAISSASANYAFCDENPAAKACPGNYDVTNEAFHVASHSHKQAPFGRHAGR